ncbi:MAG: glycoside hydrolase family 3 C-terminal domain-containing protein [Candidatus Coproplasma sp.]
MKKIFKRKLWEGLSVGCASLFVLTVGGYSIADSQRGSINSALNIDTSVIERSDDPAYQYFSSDYKDKQYSELQAYYSSVAEEVEGEGLVLLKNDNNALPLSSGEKVSTVLSGSVNFGYISSGSSASSGGSYDTLKDALSAVGLNVNGTMWDYYKSAPTRKKLGNTYLINEDGFDKMTDAAKSSLTEYSTAIVTISRSSGEGSDISAVGSDGEDGSYLSLSENEVSVLSGLTQLKAQGKVKKIIVLLNSSATVQLDFLDREGIDVDACLWVGNVGSEGINAVAKALTGETVPSGKLSDTYAKDNFSSPAAMQLSYNPGKSFAQTYVDSGDLNSTQKYYGVYSEGIYVGYRYYETRYTDYVTGRANTGNYDYSADVAYSFGYGISYADFGYSDFTVTEDGDSFTISVKVTNNGNVTGNNFSGKEVVEIYLQKPYTAYDITYGVEKSAVELVGYAKTEKLAPGEAEIVCVTVEKEQLKSYDCNNAETYILDDGDYYFAVGNGAHEAANNILAAQGYTAGNTQNRMDADGDASLTAKITVADFNGEDYAVSTGEAGSRYAKSTHTGATVTNALGDADLNKFVGEDTVTYVSRNDWTGTMPVSAVNLTATSAIKQGLESNKDIEEDEDAEMPVYGAKNGLTLQMLRGKDYDDPMWDELLDQMSFGDQSYLITTGQMATVVISSVSKPDTKEGDGPTGYSDSQGGLSFPSEGIWASTFNDELIEKVGDALAEECLYHGLTGLYANGVNIHRMPFGGRSHEYFSEDPYLTGSAAAAEIIGMQSKGVIANVKHFAFNDEEAQRNGIGVWLNEQGAREIYLAPFEYALSSSEGMGNAHAVMSGFNRVGTTWAGAYSGLLGIMRDEWGFDGYCITDMASSNGASYMTYQDGIPNGTDLYLGSGTEKSLDEFRTNATFCQAMREASHRILYSVANYSAAMNGIGPDTPVGAKTVWWEQALIAAECTFGVLTAASCAMWIASLVLSKKKDKDAAD